LREHLACLTADVHTHGRRRAIAERRTFCNVDGIDQIKVSTEPAALTTSEEGARFFSVCKEVVAAILEPSS
jgi:hypothetical protein